MPSFRLLKLEQLQSTELLPLLHESRAQGFEFLDRLAEEYNQGINRFDKPGEALLGVYTEQMLIGIGGLNLDPYLGDPSVARLRHLYVAAAYRRHGVGRLIVQAVIDEARKLFRLLTLRTFSPEAAVFYVRLGFQVEPPIAGATHYLPLTEDTQL